MSVIWPKIREHSSFIVKNQVRCLSRGRLSPLTHTKNQRTRAQNTAFYVASLGVGMFAASFAAVPLYKVYCQSTGKGGQAVRVEKEEKIVEMKKDPSRLLTIKFTAQTHSSMPWSFTPVQEQINVHPGETALIFYRVKNPLDEPVLGVATYNVLPYEAGLYFNKIQCFCFEEQILQPQEDVFMPVLFYVDPDYSKDPQLANINEIILSYVFFRSKDGEYPDLDELIEPKKHK